jgi:hypothetical protein
MNTMMKRHTNDIRSTLAIGGNHWYFWKSSTTQESTTWWTFRVTTTGGGVCLRGGTTARFSNPSRLLQRITKISDLQGTQYWWWQIEGQGKIRGKQASGEDQDTPLSKRNLLDNEIESHDRFAASQERRREEKGTGRCGSGHVRRHVGEEGRGRIWD